MTAAKALAERGAGVVLVERKESLGGMARELTCKGLVECRNCGVCFAIDRAHDAVRDVNSEVLLLSEVSSIVKEGDKFVAKIKTSPRYVTDDCTGCGKCVAVCPVEGKAIFQPTGSGQPRTYWINRDACLHFKKGKCSACSEACPTKAIDFEDRARNVTRKADAVV